MGTFQGQRAPFSQVETGPLRPGGPAPLLLKNDDQHHISYGGRRVASGLLSQRADIPRSAWAVDRWGRLLSGGLTLLLAVLALADWAPGAGLFLVLLAATGAQLVATALVGWCPLNLLLKRMGAREREEIYAGELRSRLGEVSGCSGTGSSAE